MRRERPHPCGMLEGGEVAAGGVAEEVGAEKGPGGGGHEGGRNRLASKGEIARGGKSVGAAFGFGSDSYARDSAAVIDSISISEREA